MKPAVVQTWIYHANLLGGISSKMVWNVPVVRGIHHATLNPSRDKQRTILVVKAYARISKWVQAKIVCGAAEVTLSSEGSPHLIFKQEIVEKLFAIEAVRQTRFCGIRPLYIVLNFVYMAIFWGFRSRIWV